MQSAADRWAKLLESLPQAMDARTAGYTFDNFVAGTENAMPLKAAMDVANNPGASICNPLYLYGPPGVGKTHLLYAIAASIAQENPQAKIVYTNSEQFIGEMIEALRNGKKNAFHAKYAEADILLVDDIQFLAGKTASQTEFLHAFTQLHQQGKQIVLTSDRVPQDTPMLTEQLQVQFSGSVIVPVVTPSLESRKQIITQKASRLGLALDEDMICLLAEKLTRDVRQIEGGLRKILAYRDLSDMELTTNNIALVLEDSYPNT